LLTPEGFSNIGRVKTELSGLHQLVQILDVDQSKIQILKSKIELPPTNKKSSNFQFAEVGAFLRFGLISRLNFTDVKP
jgi:hypothetical protein